MTSGPGDTAGERNGDRLRGLFDVFGPHFDRFVTVFDRFMAGFDRFFRGWFLVNPWDKWG
jgi:hypothetical protein